jgi:hypothetical protein
MTELNITDEQRDALDNQIRERILREQSRTNPEELPITAMVYARVSLGINLENACPYMRACNNQAPDLCDNYRECLFYKSSLAGDVVTGQIDLVAAGLEVLAN